jgi:hypothetical protein
MEEFESGGLYTEIIEKHKKEEGGDTNSSVAAEGEDGEDRPDWEREEEGEGRDRETGREGDEERDIERDVETGSERDTETDEGRDEDRDAEESDRDEEATGGSGLRRGACVGMEIVMPHRSGLGIAIELYASDGIRELTKIRLRMWLASSLVAFTG